MRHICIKWNQPCKALVVAGTVWTYMWSVRTITLAPQTMHARMAVHFGRSNDGDDGSLTEKKILLLSGVMLKGVIASPHPDGHYLLSTTFWSWITSLCWVLYVARRTTFLRVKAWKICDDAKELKFWDSIILCVQAGAVAVVVTWEQFRAKISGLYMLHGCCLPPYSND